MRQLYNKNNVISNEKQLKILLAIYLLIALIFLGGIVTCIVLFANEPFGTSKRVPLLIIMLAIAVVTVVFSFFYFNLIFGPVKKYVDFLKYTVFGKRNTLSLTILDVFYQPMNYKGLDFYRISTLEWNDIKNDFVERTVLVDESIVINDLKAGDIVKCQLAQSCLVAYEKDSYEKN